MERYVDILKKNDLKITHHRLAILKLLDANRTHPTAEEIYQHLKKTDPGLSRTTVYNNLDTLSDARIIKKLTICPTEHRYDFDYSMHHHFICKECGTIYDVEFECPQISKIKNYVINQGHRIDEVHGYFKGICNRCIQNRKGDKQ